MNNLTLDMEIFPLTLGKLNELIEKRAQEIADKKIGEVNKIILENNLIKDGGKIYKIYEKNEDNTESVTTFAKVHAACAYISNKYKYELNPTGFHNLKDRLDEEPKRRTKIDDIFRDKVLRIEVLKKEK